MLAMPHKPSLAWTRLSMRTYPPVAPRVLDDPVPAAAGVGTVPDHRDGVVGPGGAGPREHAALGVLEGGGVDGYHDRLPCHGELQRGGLAVARDGGGTADPADADPATPALVLHSHAVARPPLRATHHMADAG